MIERAYRTCEALGLQVWGEDEAGPYEAISQPGASWCPDGAPGLQPHEYIRGGTAKLLDLVFPEADGWDVIGVVRANPETRAAHRRDVREVQAHQHS